MRDDIYFGNIAGILKTGKWTLSLSEASALLQLYQETEKRLKPPAAVPVSEPIKAPAKKKRVKKEPTNGDK